MILHLHCNSLSVAVADMSLELDTSISQTEWRKGSFSESQCNNYNFTKFLDWLYDVRKRGKKDRRPWKSQESRRRAVRQTRRKDLYWSSLMLQLEDLIFLKSTTLFTMIIPVTVRFLYIEVEEQQELRKVDTLFLLSLITKCPSWLTWEFMFLKN